jgi:hypothetical protein
VDAGEIIGIVVGAVGAIPATLGAASWAGRRFGARRVLGMSTRGQLDVVVTTSQIAVSDREVSRPMTGIGQLDGAMSCARAIGRVYRKKRLVAHMSVSPRNSLQNDVVLLGGISSNDASRQLYCSLRERFGPEALCFNDKSNDLFVADWRCRSYDLGLRRNNTVARDLGLIVFWVNPESPEDARCRAILCLGFSTYGTEAAATFAFTELVPTSAKTLIRDRGPFCDVRRKCRTLDNCVICVVSANFSEQALRIGAPQLMAWACYGPEGLCGFRSLQSAPECRTTVE